MSSCTLESVTASTRTGTISVTTRTTAPTSTPATSLMHPTGPASMSTNAGHAEDQAFPRGSVTATAISLTPSESVAGIVARTQMAMGPVTTAKSRDAWIQRQAISMQPPPRTMEAVNSPVARIPKHRISIRMPMWMTAVAPIQVARIPRLGITMPRPTWTTAVASPMPVAWMENWSSPLIMLSPLQPCPFRQEARWFGKMSPPRSTM